MDNTALLSAEAEAEPQGWVIRLILSSEAKNRFGEITAKFLERRLAILIDGKVLCAPVVKTAILGGVLEISGNFGEDEARKLAADLNAAGKETDAPAATPGNP